MFKIYRSFLSLLFAWKCLDEEKAKQDPAYHLKSTNMETRETLAELYRDYKGDQLLASTSKEPEAKKTDKLNAVSRHYCGSVNINFFPKLNMHLKLIRDSNWPSV